jgi:hypothetical protein
MSAGYAQCAQCRVSQPLSLDTPPARVAAIVREHVAAHGAHAGVVVQLPCAPEDAARCRPQTRRRAVPCAWCGAIATRRDEDGDPICAACAARSTRTIGAWVPRAIARALTALAQQSGSQWSQVYADLESLRAELGIDPQRPVRAFTALEALDETFDAIAALRSVDGDDAWIALRDARLAGMEQVLRSIDSARR